MPGTWEFIEPYDPIKSFTVTPIAGGVQAAGTYDFMCVITNSTSNFRFGASVESPPVIVEGIVLDGTQGIRIDVEWNDTHQAGYKAFFWWKYSGDARWDNPTRGMTPDASYSNNHIQNPETSKSMSRFGGSSYFPCVSILGIDVLGFDSKKGAGIIQISGNWSENDSMAVIFNDMEAKGLANTDISKWNGYNSFYGFWSIELINGVSGIINWYGFKLFVMAFDMGKLVTDGRNFTVKAFSGADDSFELHVPRYCGSSIYTYLYNTILHGATISLGKAYMSTSAFGSMQLGLFGTQLINCRLHSGYPSINNASTYLETVIYCGQLMAGYSHFVNYAKGITLFGILRLDSRYELKFENLIINTSGYQIDYRLLYESSKSQRFLNCKFRQIDSNNNILREEDYPFIIYWSYTSYGYFQMCHVEHYFSILIIDEDNQYVSGANVKLFNKYNELIIDEFSDSQIPISSIITTMKITHNGMDGQGDDKQNFDNQYPFTLIITKDGYLPCDITIEKLNFDLNWTIPIYKLQPKIYTSINLNSKLDAQKKLEGEITKSVVKGEISNT